MVPPIVGCEKVRMSAVKRKLRTYSTYGNSEGYYEMLPILVSVFHTVTYAGHNEESACCGQDPLRLGAAGAQKIANRSITVGLRGECTLDHVSRIAMLLRL